MPQQYPAEFYCPITQEIMTDPVIGSDGHTYERSAIEEWLRLHSVSPMTRQTMHANNLIPNLALRNTIEQITSGVIDHHQQSQGVGTLNSQQTVNNPSIAKVDLGLSLKVGTMQQVQPKNFNSTEKLVHIQVIPPVEGERQPSSFICILDVSASMGSDAEKDTTKGNENYGFSRLDLVKHSVRTVIEMMTDIDHLSLITFNERAKVVLSLSKMDANGKKKAIAELEKLQPEGQTNIWDALRTALKMTESDICKDTNVALVLFTDGEPNINPPRGIMKTLERQTQDQPLNCSIHTFGFGYNLDSKLLADIAQHGSGSYAYIPDCTMVGTVFCNAISNILACAVRQTTIQLQAQDGAEILSVMGHEGCEKTKTIKLGAVQYGQDRDYLLLVKAPTNQASVTVTLNYDDNTYTKTTNLIVPLNAIQSEEEINELGVQYTRLYFIDHITECFRNTIKTRSVTESSKLLKLTIEQINSWPAVCDERVKCLIRDVTSDVESEGQVGKAFSKYDWFEKWGVHFLPSLLKAHTMQQCNNFKDPGVQIYGGKLFKELQDHADDVFVKLPPPKPSNKSTYSPHTGTYSSSSNTYSAPVSMSYYYNAGGSCFDGDSQALMSDGLLKKVSHIQKGDKLKNMNGSDDCTVVCVVKSKTVSDVVRMVELNGMKITEYHPVRINGEWKFPINIKPSSQVRCDHVYNLIVDRGHVVSINGVECITLGHGFTDSAVVTHPYYGTEKIVKDLSEMKGFTEGLVELENYKVVRDPNTGLVNSVFQ